MPAPALSASSRLAVLERQRKRQGAVEPGPREAGFRRRELAHLGVLGRGHRLRGRVDRDAGHEGRRVPGAQQRRAHHQVAGGARVHAVRDDLSREVGVVLQDRGDPGVHGVAEVHDRGLLLRAQGRDVAAEAAQRVVVAGEELRRSSHVVEGRGADEGEPDAGQGLLQLRDDRPVALAERRERHRVERLVAAVVHAEHDRDHGRLEGDDVALEADVDRARPAAPHRVPAHAGVVEADVPLREAGADVLLDEARVGAVLRDAVAVEDDPVPVPQGEGSGRLGRRGGGRRGDGEG